MIQDTSSQDVMVKKPKFGFSTKWVFLITGVLIFLGILFNALSNWSSYSQDVDKSRVRIAEVQRGSFIRDIALQGLIIAANSPKLYAPAVGNVTLNVNPGDREIVEAHGGKILINNRDKKGLAVIIILPLKEGD